MASEAQNRQRIVGQIVRVERQLGMEVSTERAARQRLVDQVELIKATLIGATSRLLWLGMVVAANVVLTAVLLVKVFL